MNERHTLKRAHNSSSQATYIQCVYRMDLNFRGTKLSRIENFRVFCVFIFADGVPLYYIEYISVLICASHISHIRSLSRLREESEKL